MATSKGRVDFWKKFHCSSLATSVRKIQPQQQLPLCHPPWSSPTSLGHLCQLCVSVPSIRPLALYTQHSIRAMCCAMGTGNHQKVGRGRGWAGVLTIYVFCLFVCCCPFSFVAGGTYDQVTILFWWCLCHVMAFTHRGLPNGGYWLLDGPIVIT